MTKAEAHRLALLLVAATANSLALTLYDRKKLRRSLEELVLVVEPRLDGDGALTFHVQDVESGHR